MELRACANSGFQAFLVGKAWSRGYIASSKMDIRGIWGTETEMFALAHMLQTDIYSYNTDDHKWHKYDITDVDRNESDNVTRISIYIHHPDNHFEVVRSIRP